MTAPIKPRLRKGAGLVESGDEAILYNPLHEHLYYLNPTATVVLQLCDGSASIAETAAELAAALDLDPAVVERDVRHVVRQFRRNDVLVNGDEPDEPVEPEPDPRERIRMEVPAST